MSAIVTPRPTTNDFSDPRTAAVGETPDCFLCGKKILRYASRRGVSLEVVGAPGTYGPELDCHDLCMTGIPLWLIEAKYRLAIVDIATQKARYGPWPA